MALTRDSAGIVSGGGQSAIFITEDGRRGTQSNTEVAVHTLIGTQPGLWRADQGDRRLHAGRRASRYANVSVFHRVPRLLRSVIKIAD